MKILNNKQIDQKIVRLAYQILENNISVKNIVFAGINSNGYKFASLLKDAYDKISDNGSLIGRIMLDPAAPLKKKIELEIDSSDLSGKSIIIVDDVANTGRTIFYAMKPLMNYVPKRLEAAVLIDRTHKTFPVKVDYVGMSLATTLKEHIKVDIKKEGKKSAFLE